MPAGELGWRRRGLLRSGVPSKAQWRRRSPASGSGGGEASGRQWQIRAASPDLASLSGFRPRSGGALGRCEAQGWRRRARARGASPARGWSSCAARRGRRYEAAWRHLLAPDRRGASLGASATPALQPPPIPTPTPLVSTAATTTLPSLGFFLFASRRGCPPPLSPFFSLPPWQLYCLVV